MPVLNNGEWEAPFWGASKTFITGQDMLGMQATSIATYATLLPGLTNLTRRIRYYGFYTWILEQYAKTKGKVSVSEFQRFVRRGELLLAFVMTYNQPEERGVVGSLYARKELQKDTDPIDIASGADRDLEHGNLYWQYSSGAFGQYYQGTLLALGLIAPSENENRIFVCTPHYGRKLAGLFENTISENTRQDYLAAIANGTVSRNQLSIFDKEFSLTGIQPHSAEWEFFIQMLFGRDYPTIDIPTGHGTFRLETILLYLEYLDSQNQYEKAGSFPQSFHYRLWTKQPFVNFTACTGWHYYALNELAHYVLETFLWAFLVDLENRSPISLPGILDSFSDQVNAALTHNDGDEGNLAEVSFGTFSKNLYQEAFEPVSISATITEVGRDACFDGVANALKVLGLIYQHNKDHISQLNAYARNHGMYRDGDVTEFLSWTEKNERLPLPGYIRKLLLQHVINRHIEVAMRKMRNRNENTLKFILEDNSFKHVDTSEPVWTSPRIVSLHQFLVDLKLVEGSDLTDLGRQLLADKQQ
jgi:hypothetical protein